MVIVFLASPVKKSKSHEFDIESRFAVASVVSTSVENNGAISPTSTRRALEEQVGETNLHNGAQVGGV